MDSRFFGIAQAALALALWDASLPFLSAAGLPPGLYARMETSKGQIVCRLFVDKTPTAVRNFGLLAQGATEWTDPKDKKKTRRPFYNDLPFYKVMTDGLIASGDPSGDGTADAGYSVELEIHPGLKFDEPGFLALDNSGSKASGSRFFITLKPMPEKNGLYTIFGKVIKGLGAAGKISKVKADDNGRPLKPVLLKTVKIFRVEEPPPKKKKN